MQYNLVPKLHEMQNPFSKEKGGVNTIEILFFEKKYSLHLDKAVRKPFLHFIKRSFYNNLPVIPFVYILAYLFV